MVQVTRCSGNAGFVVQNSNGRAPRQRDGNFVSLATRTLACQSTLHGQCKSLQDLVGHSSDATEPHPSGRSWFSKPVSQQLLCRHNCRWPPTARRWREEIGMIHGNIVHGLDSADASALPPGFGSCTVCTMVNPGPRNVKVHFQQGWGLS